MSTTFDQHKDAANKEAILNLYMYFAQYIKHRLPEGAVDIETICRVLDTVDPTTWVNPNGDEETFGPEYVERFKNGVAKYPELRNYKLSDQVLDPNGMNAAVFVSGDNQYTVVYRGTANGEWIDNGEALSGVPEENTYHTYDSNGKIVSSKRVSNDYVSDQQALALNFFNQMAAKHGWTTDTDITVSGHSKGGNNAQFVTLNSDLVDVCYSLDGEGFSPEALNQFSEACGRTEYENRRQKIYSFAAQNDYVNILGLRAAPEDHVFFIEAPEAKGNVILNHYPHVYLSDEGTFRSDAVSQGEISRSLQELSDQMMMLPPEKRADVTLGVMNILQNFVGKGTPVNNDRVSVEQSIAGIEDMVELVLSSDTLLHDIAKDLRGEGATPFQVAELELTLKAAALLANDILNVANAGNEVQNFVQDIRQSYQELTEKKQEATVEAIDSTADFLHFCLDKVEERHNQKQGRNQNAAAEAEQAQADRGFVLLDTSSFKAVIDQKESLIQEYDAINAEYDRIVNALMANWKGKGAEAFAEDAKKVKTNIAGIYDILKAMCDTLTDCNDIFNQCDTSLSEYNKNPKK